MTSYTHAAHTQHLEDVEATLIEMDGEFDDLGQMWVDAKRRIDKIIRSSET